jgi:hypothetical protein
MKLDHIKERMHAGFQKQYIQRIHEFSQMESHPLQILLYRLTITTDPEKEEETPVKRRSWEELYNWRVN